MVVAVPKLSMELVLPPFAQELKSEYNSLASAYATSQESGQLLAETCHDPEQRGVLEDQVTRLRDDWEELGQLFKDHLQKLTEALVQVSTGSHLLDCNCFEDRLIVRLSHLLHC